MFSIKITKFANKSIIGLSRQNFTHKPWSNHSSSSNSPQNYTNNMNDIDNDLDNPSYHSSFLSEQDNMNDHIDNDMEYTRYEGYEKGSKSLFDKYSHIFEGDSTITDSKNSIQMMIARNPLTRTKWFLHLLAHENHHIKTLNENEYYIPPKIHENSIFLYQSKSFANTIRAARSSDYGYMLFGAWLMNQQPWLMIPVFGVFYLVYANAFFYEINRRLVVRMDLLPHLEMIHFQKITAFGEPCSHLVRIQDLEKVNIEEIKENEEYFWAQNGQLDSDLIYRDNRTKELFCFDKEGYWDWKGLSHELLY